MTLRSHIALASYRLSVWLSLHAPIWIVIDQVLVLSKWIQAREPV